MSSCLILQEQNRIFIGADTASSICIEGKYYRYSNDAQKIFNIGNDLLFCSGNMNVVKEVIEYTRYIILNNYININLLSEYLKLYYSIQKENVFDIEIMLCRIENNESVIYQISQYNNYNPIIYKVEKDNIQLLSGGIETELSSNISQKCLSNRNTVKETYVTVFNTISSEKIGGKLLVYELSKDELKLIINYDIVEKNNLQFSKTVTPHLVVADAVVGKLMLTSKLIVENANSSVILNENGATLQNCDIKITKDTSILKLNATDGIKLTNNGVNQFYIDGSGNATFVGIIKGGSININNRFIVDANGNLTANNATLNNGSFSGSISGSTITGSSFNAQNGNYDMVLNEKGLTFTNVSNSGDQLIINSLNIGWKRSDGSLSSILLPGFVSTPEVQTQGIKIVGTTNFVINNPANATVKINTYDILTAGNFGSYCAAKSHSHNSDDIVGNYTSDNNIRFNGAHNGASVTYVQSYFARTSHTHSSTDVYGVPTGSNNISLAGSLNAASVTYCQDTFVRKDSSDFRLKYNIVSMNDEFLSIYSCFKPKMYKFKDNLFSDKKCSGLLAQEIMTNFEMNGLDWREYDLIEEYKTRDYLSEGMYTGDTAYRVKYENLHAYHIAFSQFLYNEIDKLKNEILDLKQNSL